MASNLEPLVLADPGAPLIKEIGNLRNNLTTHLGFLLPPVKFHDSKSLKENKYSIFINGVEIDASKAYSDCYSVTQYHWMESFQEQPNEYISAVIPIQIVKSFIWSRKKLSKVW